MIKLIGSIILIQILCAYGSLPSLQQVEQNLTTTLLNGYNKNIRPDQQVIVTVTASLQQIIGIDEKQQIMTSSLFITQIWNDDRLSWTPNASSGIEVIMLPVKSLWIPDTMILNSGDTSGYLTISDYSLASVNYEGSVYIVLPALSVKTRCNLMVKNFPFDKQICSINLTSWSQAINRVLYVENDSIVIDIDGYTEHPLWKLTKTDMIVLETEDRAGFEESSNHIICILLFLERKPLYFMVNGIFTCLVLNCVTLISFLLPFSAQVGLCMTCFLTYSVNSLNFSNLFPQQSEYLMMITLYFLLSICWTLLALIWFVVCNEYTVKGEMPRILERFSQQLQKIFCCCFSSTTTNEIFCFTCETKKRVFVEDTPTSIDTDQTNKSEQSKCDFCNRCQTCQEDFDKDKTKGKKKKEIETKCRALNYFMLIVIFLFIFIANMALWISMGQ